MALHARDRIDPTTAERVDRSYRPKKRTRWRPADDFPLPADVLRRPATDPDPRMRQLAPRDPDLPVRLVRRLAVGPDQSVRSAIATRPRLPTRELTQCWPIRRKRSRAPRPAVPACRSGTCTGSSPWQACDTSGQLGRRIEWLAVTGGSGATGFTCGVATRVLAAVSGRPRQAPDASGRVLRLLPRQRRRNSALTRPGEFGYRVVRGVGVTTVPAGGEAGPFCRTGNRSGVAAARGATVGR